MASLTAAQALLFHLQACAPVLPWLPEPGPLCPTLSYVHCSPLQFEDHPGLPGLFFPPWVLAPHSRTQTHRRTRPLAKNSHPWVPESCVSYRSNRDLARRSRTSEKEPWKCICYVLILNVKVCHIKSRSYYTGGWIVTAVRSPRIHTAQRAILPG